MGTSAESGLVVSPVRDPRQHGHRAYRARVGLGTFGPCRGETLQFRYYSECPAVTYSGLALDPHLVTRRHLLSVDLDHGDSDAAASRARRWCLRVIAWCLRRHVDHRSRACFLAVDTCDLAMLISRSVSAIERRIHPISGGHSSSARRPPAGSGIPPFRHLPSETASSPGGR
jgi:hypothetical protein